MLGKPLTLAAGLLVMVAISSACSDDDSQDDPQGPSSTTSATTTVSDAGRDDLQAALQQNRELWESQEIDDYSYAYTASDHSGASCTAGVDVRAAEVVTVEVLEGEPDLCPGTPEDLLVDSLFDEAEERISPNSVTAEEIPGVELSFDSEYGYLTAASFPYDPEASDNTESFEVEGLEAVEPGAEPQYSS
ncbi:MAG: hypothetical protein JJLCMIEE_00643 [Acidimicrobiales bacterium]|nr:hypothetical protein [Acidimicrobiales bacterium]RIK07529.1 MAG: hypothetical protein DCC48_03240 [Acidobacteriota bacterium]